MQTRIFRNSRFQTYGLVIILMLASASIGALSAIYFGPAVASGTTQPVMPQAAPAVEPAVAPQRSAVTDTTEADQLLREQRDQCLFQRELDNMQRVRAADLARWFAIGEAYKQRIPSDGQWPGLP